jgi:hypothetical protein
MFSLQHVLGAVGLCAAVVLPALAQETQTVQEANSLTVTRDADTGKLRAANADEQSAMAAAKARMLIRVAPKQALQKDHASGAHGARLTDEMVASSALIATRGADGKVTIAHGDPDSVAQGQAQAPATTTPATE